MRIVHLARKSSNPVISAKGVGEIHVVPLELEEGLPGHLLRLLRHYFDAAQFLARGGVLREHVPDLDLAFHYYVRTNGRPLLGGLHVFRHLAERRQCRRLGHVSEGLHAWVVHAEVRQHLLRIPQLLGRPDCVHVDRLKIPGWLLDLSVLRVEGEEAEIFHRLGGVGISHFGRRAAEGCEDGLGLGPAEGVVSHNIVISHSS